MLKTKKSHWRASLQASHGFLRQMEVWYSTTCSFRGMICMLTHWGRLTLVCVDKLTITGSDNGLSPGRCHAIIWTNASILLIWLLRTMFSEILIETQPFSPKKRHLKMSSAKWWPFCVGFNVLTDKTFIGCLETPSTLLLSIKHAK